MDEGFEAVGHVLTVDGGDRLARTAQVFGGQVRVGVVRLIGVVANDSDSITRLRLAALAHRLPSCRHTPLGLRVESRGVVAQRDALFLILSPEARRSPQLADRDTVE